MGTPKSRRSQSIEAIQRNKRMARTLGCLVASMTLGAALLDWVQPKRSPADTPRTELVSIVQHGTPVANWRAIQLDPQPAGSEGVRSHFVISREGRAFSTRRWLNQESVGLEGIVRIGLLAADNSNEVTPAQVRKANDLILALQHECGIPGDQVHYDALVVPTVPEPRPSGSVAAPGTSPRR